MLKAQRTIWERLILLLLIGLLVGCGTPQKPTPTATATPIPTPMVRVTIQLNDVYCNGTQAVWGWQQDTFYMLTTFSASGPTPTSAVVTQSQLSDPVSIGNNQDRAISPGPLVVFNALLPLDGTIRGGFTGFNRGIADDQIAQFASWGFSIAKKVGDQLYNESVESEDLPMEGGATILSLGAQAFLALLGPSDNPTQLGKQAIEISSNGPQVDPETLSFVQTNGPGNTWNYLIHYTITRTFTSNTN
jgi:hypothetical protein